MNTSKYKPVAKSVSFIKGNLIINLEDDKKIYAPLANFPNLNNASEKEKKNYSIIANGKTINWEDIDELLSVEYLYQDYGTASSLKESMEVNDIPSFLR